MFTAIRVYQSDHVSVGKSTRVERNVRRMQQIYYFAKIWRLNKGLCGFVLKYLTILTYCCQTINYFCEAYIDKNNLQPKT